MEEVFKVYKVSWPNNNRRTVYEVSNMGRVKVNGIITEPKTFSTGYQRIGGELLHRVVAQLFIPNPDNKPEVDHINTIITDNRVDNLRWVTSSENTHNELTIKHMSECQIGKHFGPKTEEHKAKLRKPKNIKHTEEWLKRNRNRYKGKTWKIIDGKRVWMNREVS